jgi:hypothetical protein
MLSNIENGVFCDFDDWIKHNRFHSCAIPTYLVESSVPFNGKNLPFVRVQKEKYKYSLPSTIVNYILWWKKEPTLFPPEHIDFSCFNQYEIPVYADQNQYIPIVDIILLGKISQFHDPRRVFMDYAERTGQIITELFTEDSSGESMIQLMRQLEPNDKFLLSASGASWWTRIPLPYLKEWEKTISSTIPTLHSELLSQLIMEFFTTGITKEIPVEITITDEYIKTHQRYNKEFWKKSLSNAKQAAKKAKPTEQKKRGSPDEDNAFLLLNMDENLRLVEDFFMQQHLVEEEVKTTNEFNFESFAGLVDNLERPLWETNDNPTHEEAHEVEEKSVEEIEDLLLAQVLDSTNFKWDQDIDDTDLTS